jgi:hypothetical protein
MNRKILLFSCVLFFSLFYAHKALRAEVLPAEDSKTSHILYFGFAAIDCGYDDPTDAPLKKTNYVDEVAAYSNLGHMCVFDPNDQSLGERLDQFDRHGIKAVLAIQNILFETSDQTAPSGGPAWKLRPDYAARWNSLLQSTKLSGDTSRIIAFYLFDEPVWNGLNLSDLDRAAQLVKKSFPDLPIAVVEAYKTLREFDIPKTIDWVGFNRYGVPDPSTDAQYLADLSYLESKLTRSEQKLLIIMETRWLPFYADHGYAPEDMAQIAQNYYALAQGNKRVIGIIGWLWPGGFDNANELGARALPQNVKTVYKDIIDEINTAAPIPLPR